MSLSPLLRGYDQVILDLDGCVWMGDQPIDGSVAAVAALRDGGKKVAFATNNSFFPGEEHVTKLWRLGIQASLADVVTVGGALQHLLADTRPGRTAFVIGSPSLHRHVTDAGLKVLNGTDLASRVDVVIVGGTDDVHYDDLRNATLAVRRGAELLGTARDPTLPMPDGFWPGTGAILAAVETASEERATIVGKPRPQLFLTALDRLGEGRTLVVGDRLDSDIAAAEAAGLDGALVLSGGAKPDRDGGDGPQPIAVADTLARLVIAA